MKPKQQVRDLGRRFEIETPHVEHVARLALTLFDGFGFDPAERPLLAAAARLHDIGVASDPGNHVEAGLQILRDHPLDCFSSREWKVICLVVSLHRRKWRPLVTEAVLEELGRESVETAKRLAAALRIADGLDHSHIQDASIVTCRRGKKVDKIRVRCGWYDGNIPWAEGKADLWEAVFQRSFQIKKEMQKKVSPFDGVVRSRDSAVCAGRRILVSQYDVMRDQVLGILEQIDPKYLHDYRVALRRFRVALRLFRPLLAHTSAPALELAMSALSDLIGPPRDAHVLLAFFQSLESAAAEQPDVFQALEEMSTAAHRRAAAVIESDECQHAVSMMSRLLRVELPALERDDSGAPEFRAYLRPRLRQQMRRLERATLPETAEELHALRKRCRRARYEAEFAVPVCGAKTARRARWLKALASALGDLRDIDLHAEALAELGYQDAGISDVKRAAAVAKVSRVWKKRAGS